MKDSIDQHWFMKSKIGRYFGADILLYKLDRKAKKPRKKLQNERQSQPKSFYENSKLFCNWNYELVFLYIKVKSKLVTLVSNPQYQINKIQSP